MVAILVGGTSHAQLRHIHAPSTAEVGRFRIKSIGLSRTTGHKPATLSIAARHNLREIQAEQGAAGHIDPSRMTSNVILAGPKIAHEVQALANELLAKVDTSRLKRDHCQAIEALFSLPTRTSINTEVFFANCLAWIGHVMGLPVLSAVAHHDEGAPHLHVLMLPIKAGRHVGSSCIVRARVRALQMDFFTSVAGPAGLQRADAKLRGVAKRRGIAAVVAYCKSTGIAASCGPLWSEFVAGIERDPMPHLRALEIDLQSL